MPLFYQARRFSWRKIRFDSTLLFLLVLVMAAGLFILYSASNENLIIVQQQAVRLVLALGVMLLMAQIPPDKYRWWAPWLFIVGMILLVAVLAVGHVGKGAQRWLHLGVIRFQPSEIMKLALPLMLAWYFSNKHLPPKFWHLIVAGLIIIIPVALTAKQPDLGTALLIGAAGGCVLLLAGISWRILLAGAIAIGSAIPVLWHYMHDYQRQRVLTFLNPDQDPLGAGYHIIQSEIAIGSGGMYGKGWLEGTQSHLQFLPEHATDFIFAVCGEELGLMGGIGLIFLFLLVAGRGMFIALNAQDNFTRLLAGSLTLTFFLSIFINIGMVIGILPVVGLPLPLVSYGGTAYVTTLASFGILMSIQTHPRRLLPS